MKPRFPLWVSLLQSAATTLAPSPEDDQAEQDAAIDACEPWVVRVGNVTLRVVYESPLDQRREGPA
jgi:hypothetical protein